jgi:threonine/homoserine/homoserine lactone efflux protein
MLEFRAMTIATLLAFSLVALIAIATPGPTVLLALANGTRFGLKRAVPGMLGAVASDFVLVGAVALGLGALLAASEFWFTVVKWLGAAYLAWLGWRLLRSKGGLDMSAAAGGEAGGAARAVFGKCFLVAVTNPKGYLFCSALLPQFIDPAQPQGPQYLLIALVFAGLDFLVMFAYAAIGAHAIRLLHRRAVLWLDRCCGGALLVLSGSLLLYRRSSSSP